MGMFKKSTFGDDDDDDDDDDWWHLKKTIKTDFWTYFS